MIPIVHLKPAYSFVCPACGTESLAHVVYGLLPSAVVCSHCALRCDVDEARDRGEEDGS